MSIAAVVADANVLLSAAIGKAAARVFTESSVIVHATRFNCHEVEEYLPRLSSQYRLDLEIVEMQWRLLHPQVHDEAKYAPMMARARSLLADRDPDDAHVLALALHLKLPIWSNDNDLVARGAVRLTTAQLLATIAPRK